MPLHKARASYLSSLNNMSPSLAARDSDRVTFRNFPGGEIGQLLRIGVLERCRGYRARYRQ
jgi:hypothetical protein